jgi:hypothetical protein
MIIVPPYHIRDTNLVAGVAKLADAPDLGSGGVIPVEVRVLSPALKTRHDELETYILAG